MGGIGAATWTAPTTSSYWAAPVIASTCGKRARIISASLPMQPVTMTRPFSAIASPIAARLSSLARIEEAAGVDQHDVGAGIIGRHRIAVGAQLGQDPLGIDQRLRAAERDHADLGRGGEFEFHGSAPHSGMSARFS